MKSDVIVVSANEDKISDALTLAEKVAAYKELSPKSALHLRLLTEEVMSMVHAITGDVEGDFWIEDEGNVFKLHLQVRTNIDEEQREKLLSASKSGKNEATKGTQRVLWEKSVPFLNRLTGFPYFTEKIWVCLQTPFGQCVRIRSRFANILKKNVTAPMKLGMSLKNPLFSI